MYSFVYGCLDMYMSEDDHGMAMEQITERITAAVMQDLGASLWGHATVKETVKGYAMTYAQKLPCGDMQL